MTDPFAPDGQPGESWAGSGVVINAAAGTTSDGRMLIRISYAGGQATCLFLASYTPVQGDTVAYIKTGATLLVLGAHARI